MNNSEQQEHHAASKISVGADHAGFRLKDHLAEHLTAKGFEILDMGTNSPESCDYPTSPGRWPSPSHPARLIWVC